METASKQTNYADHQHILIQPFLNLSILIEPFNSHNLCIQKQTQLFYPQFMVHYQWWERCAHNDLVIAVNVHAHENDIFAVYLSKN